MVDGLEREATPAGYDDQFMASHEESLANVGEKNEEVLLDVDLEGTMGKLAQRLSELRAIEDRSLEEEAELDFLEDQEREAKKIAIAIERGLGRD